MLGTTVRVAALLGAVMLVGLAVGQQPAKDQKPAPKSDKPAAGSLEERVAQALKNNPDIRVADAKVREAEAQLNAARVQVAQKVVTLHHSIDLARKTRKGAAERNRIIEHLSRSGQASSQEMLTARLALERADAEMAKLEAEMPALLGKLPGMTSQEKGSTDTQQAEQALSSLALVSARLLRASQADAESVASALSLIYQSQARQAKALQPQGTLADRIRKALDTPVNGDYKGKSYPDVLKDIENKLTGIPFRVVSKVDNGKMDLNLGQVPLGAAIQALNDLVPEIRFVVREYGILVTNKEWLPPGAVLLHDFWKSGAGKEKPGTQEGGKAPQADLEGLVKAVDEAAGLVSISLGSDGGLAKGHTLVVYRSQQPPMYLGAIQVVEVRPKEAVAKRVGKAAERIQVGDKVASKLVVN